MESKNLSAWEITSKPQTTALLTTGQLAKEAAITPEIVSQPIQNTIGLEHFEEVVTSIVKVAKMQGAKSVKLNCFLCGEIIF